MLLLASRKPESLLAALAARQLEAGPRAIQQVSSRAWEGSQGAVSCYWHTPLLFWFLNDPDDRNWSQAEKACSGPGSQQTAVGSGRSTEGIPLSHGAFHMIGKDKRGSKFPPFFSLLSHQVPWKPFFSERVLAFHGHLFYGWKQTVITGANSHQQQISSSLVGVYKHMKEGCKDDRDRLSSGARARGNGHKLELRILLLNTRKYFSAVQVTEPWHRLPER